ncbi:MAG TPA: hypothetical protein VK589_04055, partial [Chryseolinea sp.]|nr:hypothetical protein [Chryseolinea sp.]
MTNSPMLARFVLGCCFGISTIVAFGQQTQTNSSSVSFPLKASANSRYLIDQKDKPFPILGRTAWFMISQSVPDYKYFLDNTLAKGYN